MGMVNFQSMFCHDLQKLLKPIYDFRSQHETRKQHANPLKGSIEKPNIGQGRAVLKRKRPDPINQTINPPSELSQKIPGETKIETGKTNHIHSKDPTHSVNNVDEKDDTYKTFNPRCSLPSRFNLQAPSQTY